MLLEPFFLCVCVCVWNEKAHYCQGKLEDGNDIPPNWRSYGRREWDPCRQGFVTWGIHLFLRTTPLSISCTDVTLTAVCFRCGNIVLMGTNHDFNYLKIDNVWCSSFPWCWNSNDLFKWYTDSTQSLPTAESLSLSAASSLPLLHLYMFYINIKNFIAIMLIKVRGLFIVTKSTYILFSHLTTSRIFWCYDCYCVTFYSWSLRDSTLQSYTIDVVRFRSTYSLMVTCPYFSLSSHWGAWIDLFSSNLEPVSK